MIETIYGLLSLAVLVFSVISMLAVGFSYTLREITEPLLNVHGVLLAPIANFVLVLVAPASAGLRRSPR